MRACVNRVIRNSFIDGPGSRLVIFLQGCNMSCLYCHNPETQRPCSGCGSCVAECRYGALKVQEGSVSYDRSLCKGCDRCIARCPAFSSPKGIYRESSELLEEIKAAEDFIDGITVSGGECTLWPQFLMELFRAVKAETQLTCFIDTNGYMDHGVMAELCSIADGFMFDLKALDGGRHKKLTGVDNDQVLDNIRYASRKGLLYEIRTVIVRGYTDSREEIESISDFVRELNDYTLLRLIPFRPYGVRTQLRAGGTVEPGRLDSLVGISKDILGGRVTIST